MGSSILVCHFSNLYIQRLSTKGQQCVCMCMAAIEGKCCATMSTTSLLRQLLYLPILTVYTRALLCIDQEREREMFSCSVGMLYSYSDVCLIQLLILHNTVYDDPIDLCEHLLTLQWTSPHRVRDHIEVFSVGISPLTVHLHLGNCTYCSRVQRTDLLELTVHCAHHACNNKAEIFKAMVRLIGERERANLVVQPARFFYIYICLSVALYLAILRFYAGTLYRKSLQFHVHRISRMRSQSRVICTTAGRFACRLVVVYI